MIKSISLRLVLESDPELNQNDMKGRIRIRFNPLQIIFSTVPGAGNPCSVQTPGRLLRVSPVVHLNEGEAGGPASHPHVLHYAVLAKGVLQVIAISVLGKAP